VPLFRSNREARGLENPTVPLTAASLVELYAGSRTHSGISVSENNAHRVIAVYRAWALLGGTIGSLPLWAFNGEAPGGQRWYGDASNLLTYPGGRDEVTGIATPGSPSATVFFETAVIHALSWGQSYIVKIPNVARTRVVALDLLLPSLVQPRWCKQTADNPYGKEFVVFKQSDRDARDMRPYYIATPKDIIHVRAPGPSLLQGISPIGAARQALGMAVAAEEYGARLWGSGSLMSGILQTDQELNDVKARRLKERWQAKMAGLAGAHEVAVLDNGAKWAPITMPNKDSQFIEARSFQVTEIARLYGIPPHMLGDVDKSTSWGTGIEQQSLGFNIYTLRPWLSRFEQALSNELLPRGVNCRFQTSELLRGDAKTEAESITTKINGGIMTPNEGRAALGLAPLAGGDVLLFPSNYGSLKNVVDPPAPPAPVTADVPGADANQNDAAARGLRLDMIRGARYGGT
jgi:HK97 family phage portal protein